MHFSLQSLLSNRAGTHIIYRLPSPVSPLFRDYTPRPPGSEGILPSIAPTLQSVGATLVVRPRSWLWNCAFLYIFDATTSLAGYGASSTKAEATD